MAPTLLDIQAPSMMRECKGWLVWRLETNLNRSKPSKMPYYVNGRRRGKNGTPEDISLLTDFESAKRFAKEHNYTGVGFAFLPEFCITGLDFDNCIVDGVVDSTVEKATLGTYTEISPSGKGIHAWVRGNWGDKKTPTTDTQFGFELFNTKIWLTFTGNVTETTELIGATDTVSEPNEDLILLMMDRFGDAPTMPSFLVANSDTSDISIDMIRNALSYIPNDGGYEDWFNVGCAIHHGTEGSEEGFTLWDIWGANSPKYGTLEYGRYKWESMGKNTSIKPITPRSLIKKANKLGANIRLPKETAPRDDFDVIEEVEPIEGKIPSYFNIRTASEFIDQVEPVSWLIKKFLPKANLGVLYGEPGAGKSFVALDICAALARKMDWNGLRCKSQASRVLYVVAEGVGGFALRLTAYCHQAGISPNDLSIDIISDVVPNLTDLVNVDRLIHDIQARDPYDLVVMDTFAQVTAGSNENSGEDMGRALGYCRKISKASHAMVLLIHHSGKDASKGARGWSGVNAASDVVFEVSRFDEERCIKVTKQKDGVDGSEYGFKLVHVILGEDSDGEDIISCVVQYKEFVKPARKIALKPNQKVIHEVLSEFSPDSWVTIDHVVELALERLPEGDTPPSQRKSNVKRTLIKGIGTWISKNDNGEIMLKK